MTDIVLVKRDMLRYVQDVRAVRAMGSPCGTVQSQVSGSMD